VANEKNTRNYNENCQIAVWNLMNRQKQVGDFSKGKKTRAYNYT
jgi:hypothetical protein